MFVLGDLYQYNQHHLRKIIALYRLVENPGLIGHIMVAREVVPGV
jgi:hypothetical protein